MPFVEKTIPEVCKMEEIQFLYANTGNSIINSTHDYSIEQFLDYSSGDLPSNIEELLCQLQECCQQYEHLYRVLARKTPYIVFMAKQNERVRIIIPAQVHLDKEDFRIEGKVVHELDALLQKPDNMEWEVFVGDCVGEDNALHRLDQEEIRSVCECLYNDEEKQNTFLLFRERYGIVTPKNKSYLLLVCMLTVVFVTITVYLQRDKIFILSQSRFQQRLYKGNLALQMPPTIAQHLQKLRASAQSIKKHLEVLSEEEQAKQKILTEQKQKLESLASSIKKQYAEKALDEHKLKELEQERKKQSFLKKLMTVFSKKIKEQKKKIATHEKNIASQQAQQKVITDDITEKEKQIEKLVQRKNIYTALLQMCEKIDRYFADKTQGQFSLDLPVLDIDSPTFVPHIDDKILFDEDENNLQKIAQYATKIKTKKFAFGFQKQAIENEIFSRFILSIIDDKSYVTKEEVLQLPKIFSQKEDLDKLMTYYVNIKHENEHDLQKDQEKND